MPIREAARVTFRSASKASRATRRFRSKAPRCTSFMQRMYDIHWKHARGGRRFLSHNAKELIHVRRLGCYGEYGQGRRRNAARAEEGGPCRVARRSQRGSLE